MSDNEASGPSADTEYAAITSTAQPPHQERITMGRRSPATTILLRECIGLALAMVAFPYSAWITTLTIADFLLHLTHPEDLRFELHTFLAALDCLTWWAGVGGLRLAGWRPTWPVVVGLALIAISTIKMITVGVIGHYA
ncbi:hypothetical protein SAMN04487819_11944 [Actinopolyspora alba]|uniref:Uncharacterized protein n=1 Tax=Actinopolyspora alba TaxID=673379 RepID=A0A1I2C627_9ACTN|nr:hypothetical protein [Actinopolyspora alba]SFE63764.1 hypothetical protein SAMN04487819_11944 [Actinopolyspora alba]